MDMGQRIKELREEKHLTLEEVGNRVGVGKSTVRKWENGTIANMRRDKIASLANALGCSPGYLMGWEDRIEGNPIKAVTEDAEMLMDSECRELCSYFKKLNNANRKIVINLAKSLSEAAT